jgi:hypothetical protein
MLLFVEIVAETRDPRGVRLLRRALSSPHYEIQTFAAAGLVRARDNDSIPLIIDACKNASPDVASSIAHHWCILMILERRAQWIGIFPRMTLNPLARRRWRVLVLLDRGPLIEKHTSISKLYNAQRKATNEKLTRGPSNLCSPETFTALCG